MLFPGGSRGVVLGDFWAPELHEWPGTSCNSGFSVAEFLRMVGPGLNYGNFLSGVGPVGGSVARAVRRMTIDFHSFVMG